MKNEKLLDTFCLVRFFKAEAGSERVRALLLASRRAGTPMVMSEINAGELYYAIGRRMGLDKAEEALANLSTIPVTLVPTTWELIVAAARLKAQWPLSYADCFAVATAMARGATVVTGDPEFKHVEHLVPVEWI